MRIDYSDPKKSCSSFATPPSSQNRPRKESSGGILIIVVITALVSLGIGFGSGWMLSQRSAKQGFKAAMEQQSLENSPQQPKPQPSSQQPASLSTQQPQAGIPVPQPGSAVGTVEAPLSFYKTLPSGQKNTTLGSGINSYEKPTKQPLQAAVPANITRAATPPGDAIIKQQPPLAATAKPTTSQNPNGLTVQVSSYSLKSEAEAHRTKLAAKGYDVSIVKSNLGDKGIWYRVCVGKQLDPVAAKELAGKLGRGATAIPDKN